MKPYNFTVLMIIIGFVYISCTSSTKKQPTNENVNIVSDETYYQIAKELNATESSSEIFINLPTDDLFEDNQSKLASESESWLENTVKMINAKGTGKVMITCFSDDNTNAEAAQKLTTERAKAVADWIKKEELKSDISISSQGVGSRFGFPNKNPDGSDNLENQAKNRRVEIVIKKSRDPKE